jgi:hypothetical protein
MENLARSRNCNEDERERVNAIINQELLSAGIEIISENGAGEVPYNIIGKLGPYEFRRAWYYWMVSGLVPYDAAVEMYENEYGKKDVRCAGHCGCPHPKDQSLPKREDLHRLGLEGLTYGELYQMCNDGIIKAPRFVRGYHIDSQIGLKLFVDTIKKYNLDKV